MHDGSSEPAIAELKRNERVLREREKRYHSLVQNTSDIITVIESDGTVNYMNPATERLGYQPETQIGTNAFDWIHPNDMERGLTLFAEILENPGVHPPIEFPVPHADGSWRYFEHIVNNKLDDPSIEGIVVSSRDITERKALEERLRHQALHDPLTNLPNRVLFTDRLEQALLRRSRRKRSVAILFVDLDNFKLVNDSLGHELGDRLLIVVAERLRDCVRPEDTVARLGGDEFTVLLESVSNQGEAIEVAERITQELGQPFMLVGREFFVGSSIGIALGTPGEVRPDELLRGADAAMYRAKNKSKAYELTTGPGVNSWALERLELEGDLRRAIEREEFRVYFQPQVLLSSDRIVSLEALARWQHPKRGLLLPYEFIPIAEETGLITTIGQLVLEAACHQARAWQEQYPKDRRPMVFVNLSAKQVQQPGLVGQVTEALKKTGLDPSGLGLEITESVLMDDAQSTVGMLQRLKALGIQLAIDDFGTGYSSLSYLKRFPADYIKIDRSFVEDLRKESGGDAVLLSGIVTLARALGMQTIAEGVATAEQLSQLRKQACDLVQGNYLSKPLPSRAATALLTERL
ncbi:MAG: EAL domain-containing protein [Actinobacteria bacterium]|nr:EAL domain-containing protein [Actinomycetota bacterium]